MLPLNADPQQKEGGPPYYIHLFKKKGPTFVGHFVVSDGKGEMFMDPARGLIFSRDVLTDGDGYYSTRLNVVVDSGEPRLLP